MTRPKLTLVLLCSLLFLFWRQSALAPDNTPKLPLAQDKPPPTTLLAVGDIMLSRNVSAKIEKAEDPNLPFMRLQHVLKSADIAFGNLECPLDRGARRIYEGLIFRCLTEDFEGVVNAGFDIMSTANNHAFDQGLDSLKFTVEYLQSQNILPIGTYSSPSVGERGEILERNGTKFGFLAYSYSARNDGGKSTHAQISTMHDLDQLKSEILNLKSKTDIIIVSMHAGFEYTRTPNRDQRDFAHAAIDAGADLVIGHHPHWVQTIEIYQTSPIVYSLGNFVFDQMWSTNTREGLMAEFVFSDKKLQSAKLIPIIIDDYCCPRLASDAEKQNILKKINLTSDYLIVTRD